MEDKNSETIYFNECRRPLIPDGRPNEHGDSNMEILFSVLILNRTTELWACCRHSLFYVLCFIAFFRYCALQVGKICGRPALNKFINTVFSNSICSLLCFLCHILVIFAMFQTLSGIIFQPLFMMWWSEYLDVMCCADRWLTSVFTDDG